MRTVQQIYSDYKIMPSLQLHQLRVAAVAKIITENFQEKIDKESIIFACLFHDMGNIIKSDLNYFPEFLEPEGLEYWQSIKKEFIEKYGLDEHIATELIAKEINLPPSVIVCLEYIGFSNAKKSEISNSFEYKICNYSDMRVDPYGVTEMEKRLSEGKERYKLKPNTILSENSETLRSSLRRTEKQIFNNTKIEPNEITNDKIEHMIQELRDLVV